MSLPVLFLHRSWRAVVAIGLLVGIVAGVGLWSLAAARRTASTFTRYIGDADVSDVSIDFFPVAEQSTDMTAEFAFGLIERGGEIDGVVDDATYIGMESMALAAGGAVFDADNDASAYPEIVGSLDGRFVVQDRVAIVDGRLPRAEAADEVLVSDVMADGAGLSVGDRVPIDVYEIGTFLSNVGERAPIGRLDAEVVGVGVFPDDVLNDDYDRIARILLSRAATERWIEQAGYLWQGLRLRDPSDVDRVVAEYRALAGEDMVVITRETSEQVEGIQRSVRPVVVALTAFGIAALAAALAVGCVAVDRLARTARDDRLILRAMGAAPRTLIAAAGSPGAAAAVLAAAVATSSSVVLSPLAPLGGVRAVEPDRGIDVDTLVTLGGAGLLVLALAATTIVAAGRAGRRSIGKSEVSTAAPLVARLTAPMAPAAAVGIRRGLGTSSTAGAPVRVTLAICAVSFATVVSALAFGAGLTRLVDEPHRYGWATELALTANAGYDIIDANAVERIASDDEDIDGVTLAGFAALGLSGRDVPAMWAAAVRGVLPLTLLSGRFPSAPGEVALGRVTADQLGVGVDDDLDGPGGPLVVVGTVALPSIGQATSSHPSLGEGALLTRDGLLGIDPAAQPSVAFVDLADGVDAETVAGPLAERFAATAQEGSMEPFLLLRPAELSDATEARATVTALATVLGLAAVAGLSAVVGASINARRRELAVLRALGCTSSELRQSVRWQAACTAAAAALVGLPLGMVAGSVMWRAFAGTLGVDPSPAIPVTAIALTLVAAIVLAVLSSLPAARWASRTSVASALRPE